MVALSCSLVPMGTAWSTGISLMALLLLPVCSEEESRLELELDAADAASLKRATSYSRFPGDSSTMPETRAAGGRKRSLNQFTKGMMNTG